MKCRMSHVFSDFLNFPELGWWLTKTGISDMQELFLLVIQDKKIQRLMDELDLPPDRANLCPGVVLCGEVDWG